MNAPLNVTLRQLRVFIEVSKLRSFSRAGDEIGLTQSAVGRCAKSAIWGSKRRGRVIVAASPTIACRLMPRVIAACLAQFPLVTLSLRDDVQSDVLRKVKSGEVDFGVVIGPFSSNELYGQPVMTDSFCLVARRDHPLGREAAVRWEALAGEPLVMLDYASGSRPIIDAVMHEHGVEAHVVQELSHLATVFGLVEAGVGVSVLPWLALPADSSLVALLLAPRAERTVELVRRRDRSLSPAAESVWSLIAALPGRAEELG